MEFRKTISNALKSVAIDLLQQEDGSFKEKQKIKRDPQEVIFDSQVFQDYVKAYTNLFRQ